MDYEGNEREAITKDMLEASGEVRTSECDACGGDMFYDAESRQLKCQFCGHLEEIDFETEHVVEIAIDQLYKKDFSWDMKAKVIVCKNCGGETITEPTDETSYCSYCGSQHILEETNGDMGMRPQGVVPYAITDKKAKELMKKWVKRRWLAPNDLKERFMGKELKSIYMPYWTFDGQVDADFSVRIGEYYYTGTGDEKVRHTRWHWHEGEHSCSFDDMLEPAIENKDRELLIKIEPFHTKNNQVVDYKPEFLVGHQARKYTIMPEVAHKVARKRMEREIASEIKTYLPGDTYESYKQTVQYSKEYYKHILLPVYMTAYTYQQKIYNVLINGQTGEVQGKSPMSLWKLAGIILVISVLVLISLFFSNGNGA